MCCLSEPNAIKLLWYGVIPLSTAQYRCDSVTDRQTVGQGDLKPFGRRAKSHWSLSGVYVRGSKRSHPGKWKKPVVYALTLEKENS